MPHTACGHDIMHNYIGPEVCIRGQNIKLGLYFFLGCNFQVLYLVCSLFVWAFKGATRAIYFIHALCSPVAWEIKGTAYISLGKYRYFPVVLTFSPRGKGADHIQLNSNYTSKDNNQCTGQLYHDSQRCCQAKNLTYHGSSHRVQQQVHNQT